MIRRMIAETTDPWRVAEIYGGQLHQMDRETLDMLLANLEESLSDALSVPDWGGSEPVYGPLHLLSEIHTAALVEALRGWRGTALESRLVALVSRIGPRSGFSQGSLVCEKALELLRRIDGEGFAEAVNVLLRADSRYGRWDGLKPARQKANVETHRLLAAICEHEETWDGHYVEQCEAAAILGEQGVWPPVISLLRRIGLLATREVTELAQAGLRPSVELLDDVIASVYGSPAAASAGDVLALGFGDLTHADLVKLVASSCRPTDDVAHACAIALQMLEDHDERSVPFLKTQLAIAGHRFSATNALIVNGTVAALDELTAESGEDLDVAVAINLVNRLPDPSVAVNRAKDAIVRSVDRGATWDLTGNLWETICHIRNPDHARRLLDHPTVEEWLRDEAFADEGSSWITGSKAAAIGCLGQIDPYAAFAAARSALRNPESHDRDYYPPMLAELDSEAAADEFLSLLPIEESESVKRSIGRTLASLNVERLLMKRFEAVDPPQRRSACFSAG